MKRFIELEVIHGGEQPRPYADHLYEGYITFSVPKGQMWASKYPTLLDDVKKYVKLFANFYETPEWHQPRLDKLEQVSIEPN